MEMTSPGNLVRAGGWSRNAVKAGDRVMVDFSPLRDTSSRGGALKKVTLRRHRANPSPPTFGPRRCRGSKVAAMAAMRGLSHSRLDAAVLPRALRVWLRLSARLHWRRMKPSPPPKDTIFARKILMGTIDMNMDEVETMLAPDGKLDDVDAREHLDTISVLLMAFPHLFPRHQPVEGRRGARSRARYLCLARALDQLPDFYRRASDASKIAFEASRARRAQDFKTQVAELRAHAIPVTRAISGRSRQL